MSEGITCTGPGINGITGKDCQGIAGDETRVCGGCMHEAKELGIEMRHYTRAEQIHHARRPARPKTFGDIAKEWEYGQ